MGKQCRQGKNEKEKRNTRQPFVYAWKFEIDNERFSSLRKVKSGGERR